MNIPENFDRWMFDYKEGNLSGAEKEAFEKFLIQNPDFDTEADAWSNAFIEDEDFEYPHVEQLTKDRKVGAAWYYSAAAAVLLLIGGSILFNEPESNNSDIAFAEKFADNSSQFKSIDQLSNQELIKGHKNEATNTVSAYDSDLFNDQNLTASDIQSESRFISQFSNSNESESSNVISQNESVIQNNTSAGIHSPNSLTDEDASSEVSIGSGHNAMAMDQEVDKYDGDQAYQSSYLNNPKSADLSFDVAKTESYDFSSWQNKMKRFYHKLERVFDDPIGLTNLRDPELVMPNSSILAFNPAFAGGMLTPRFEMNYRNQWTGKSHNSQQLTLSYDNYVYEMRGGVGVMINAKDYKYGQFGDYNMSLIYSPKMLLGKNVVLEPALKMTMGVMNANGDKLTPENQFELDNGNPLSTPAAQQMSGNQQQWYKDFGLGMVINTKWFYAGFTADNLNHHFENVYNQEGFATPTATPAKISAIIGTDWENQNRPVNKPLSLSAFVAYDQFGDRKEFWGGMSTRMNWLTLGASVSNNLDFTASAGMQFEKFKLVYHYDQTTSILTNDQFGSHNLSLRINGSTKKRTNRL